MEQRQILSTHLQSEGKHAKKLWLEAPGSIYHPRLTEEMMRQGRRYPSMDGRSVFKHAVELFQEVIGEALEANQLGIEDVDLLILHQANLRISEALTQALGIPAQKVFNNIQRYGNTTAASVPIALDEAVKEERLKTGDIWDRSVNTTS